MYSGGKSLPTGDNIRTAACFSLLLGSSDSGSPIPPNGAISALYSGNGSRKISDSSAARTDSLHPQSP